MMENENIKRVLARLYHYHCEANKLMADECSPDSLSPTLKKINAYLAYLEKQVIKVSSSVDSNDKSELENLLKDQHVKKNEFDSNFYRNIQHAFCSSHF